MEPALEKLRQVILSLRLVSPVTYQDPCGWETKTLCLTCVCPEPTKVFGSPRRGAIHHCLHILQTKQKDGLKLKANLGYIVTSRPVLGYRLRPYPKKPKEKKKPNVPSLRRPVIGLFFSLISGNSVLTGSIFCNGRRKSLWVFSPNRTKTPHLKLPPTCPSYPMDICSMILYIIV